MRSGALPRPRNPGGDFVEWATLWREQGDAHLHAGVRRVRRTASKRCTTTRWPMNDAFRAEAARNIRDDPWRFAGNVLRNLYVFNLDTSYRWLDRLEYVRDGGSWRPRATLAKALTVGLLLLGLAGVVRGLRDGDDDARTLAVVYSMFCAAHAIGIVMARYTYVRLPLVLVALPLVLRGREGDARPSPSSPPSRRDLPGAGPLDPLGPRRHPGSARPRARARAREREEVTSVSRYSSDRRCVFRFARTSSSLVAARASSHISTALRQNSCFSYRRARAVIAS